MATSPVIIGIDAMTGAARTECLSLSQVIAHRIAALGITADNAPARPEDVDVLATDRWDADAVLICVLGPEVEAPPQILAAIRIASPVDGELPLSEFYDLPAGQFDLEIGRTTILPSHRGGILASMLLILSMRWIYNEQRGGGYIYVDPIVGARRGISVTSIQEMGFEVCSELVTDARYGFQCQSLRMPFSAMSRFWSWRDARFGPNGISPRELLMAL